ncbi:MAG: hypothetical protein ACI8S6_000302 [Myxococcota bacterium]|jgi:hypothetical protein
MRWVIAKNIRCDVRTFSGLNLSGRSENVQIFPSGRQGELTTPFRSMSFAGPPGTRLVLCRAILDEDWMAQAWRAILIKKPHCYRTRDGRLAVNVPDIELLDQPNAQRSDPDFEASYEFAEDVSDGQGWTYGRIGTLHEQVQTIRIDRVG